jgi:hypothetical protein
LGKSASKLTQFAPISKIQDLNFRAAKILNSIFGFQVMTQVACCTIALSFNALMAAVVSELLRICSKIQMFDCTVSSFFGSPQFVANGHRLLRDALCVL